MRVAGVDGCKADRHGGGWVAVIVETDGTVTARRLGSIAALVDGDDAPALVAIDMPIGLPDRVGPKGRAPERLVRPLLGDRQSSVFSIPSRAAVYAALDDTVADEAARYRHACAVARATSDPPKAVAKQAFHIFPKIAEIDRLLRERPDLRARIHECHPEVSFRTMNGAEPLPIAKKVRNAPNAPGLALRRQLLEAQGFDIALLSPETARLLRVGWDDLLDAAAAAWTARRIARGEALDFPSPAECDGEGLAIRIRA